jgi:hypothetical protein
MIHKSFFQCFCWLALLITLAACAPVAALPTTVPTINPTNTNIPTETLSPTQTRQPPYVYTVVDGDTCVSIAAAFGVSVESIIESNNLPSSCDIGTGGRLLIRFPKGAPIWPSPTIPLTPTPVSQIRLDGYLLAYVKNGDLYFQDGNNAPVKLTHVGEKAFQPEISPDNQKILFYRDNDGAHLINVDGTGEQKVIPDDWLKALEPGTVHLIAGFIPSTHRIFLTTYLCKREDSQQSCMVKLFVINPDNSEIDKVSGFNLLYYEPSHYRNIEISPDGKLIAVGKIDGTDVFSIDGKIIRKNVLPYKPASNFSYPSLFWLPDSSGLIMALPDGLYNTQAYSGFVAHTVWRYEIKNNVATKIPLNPPLVGDKFDISPDGKWGVYGALSGYDTEVYLGNLITGQVQIWGEAAQAEFLWGPDSRHFIVTSAGKVIGSVDKPGLKPVCYLSKWIDPSHFTCIVDEKSGTWLRMAEIDGEMLKLYDLGLDKDVLQGSIFIKPK